MHPTPAKAGSQPGPSEGLDDNVFSALLRLAAAHKQGCLPDISPINSSPLHKYLPMKWGQRSLQMGGINTGLTEASALGPVPPSSMHKNLDKMRDAPMRMITGLNEGFYAGWMKVCAHLHGISVGPFAEPLEKNAPSPREGTNLFRRFCISEDGRILVKEASRAVLNGRPGVENSAAFTETPLSAWHRERHHRHIADFWRFQDSQGPFRDAQHADPRAVAQAALRCVFDYYEVTLARELPFETVAAAMLAHGFGLMSCGQQEPEVSELSQSGQQLACISGGGTRAAEFLAAFVAGCDHVYFEHLVHFTPLYLNDTDLEKAGVSDPEARALIMRRVAQGRILGFIDSPEASAAHARFHAHALGFRIPKFAVDTGGGFSDLSKFVASQALAPEHDTERGFTVHRFHAHSRQQFSRDEPFPMHEMEDARRYPRLAKACAADPELSERLYTLIELESIRSLPELEATLGELERRVEEYGCRPVRPENLVLAITASELFARVERHWDERFPMIVVPHGVQAENHVGYGYSHLLFQREQEGLVGAGNALFAPREFEERVLQSLGTAVYHSGSRRSPQTHSLFVSSDPEIAKGTFVFIVGKLGEAHELITALHFSDAARCEEYLRRHGT